MTKTAKQREKTVIMEQPIHGRIGRFIAQLRREKGLTQKALAAQLHLTDKAVSKWERGLACPDITLLPVLAGLLDVSVEELLAGERIRASSKEQPVSQRQTPSEEEAFADTKASFGSAAKSRRWPALAVTGLTLSAVIGAAVCLICDLAINGRLTWSPIPLLSIGFCWLVLAPGLLVKHRGLWIALLAATVWIFPFFVALNSFLSVNILPIAMPMAVLGVICLWACAGVIWLCRKSPLRAAGWICLLAVPMQLAANSWLTHLLKEPPEPGWTLASSLVLAGTAVLFFLWSRK